MKKAIVALVVATALSSALWSQVTGQEIVEAMEKKMFPNSKTELLLKHTSSTGTVEEFSMNAYSKDKNQRIIVRFLAPAKSVGNDVLMQDRNVWLFDAKSGREVKIPSNQSFGDTGFSYGDVLRLNFSDNYTPTILEESEKGWTLELLAKRRDTPYFKVVLLVGKDYSPVSGKCFTQTDELIKEMTYTDVRDLGTGLKPLSVTVVSPLDPNAVSTLTVVKETKKDLPDNIFNKRNLSARLEEKM